MEDRELFRYAREAFRRMDPEIRHISVEEIAEFAKDKESSPHRQQIEKHLAECELCRQRLTDFEQFLEDSQQPPASDLTAEWQELSQRIRPYKKAAVMWRWLPAMAAAVFLIAALTWVAISRLNPSPAQLLADAYHEQRTSDYRLAGAAHAPVRVQRGSGSSFALPGSLLKAQGQLAEQIKFNPEDPDVLRLQGEAEMISREAAAAVRTLQKALDLRPEDARLLADLGAAYALRGDLEQQFGDYAPALEDLSRSLHLQPGVLEVVFNRALVLERMMLLDQAVQEWQNYLQLDSASGWAEEARKHLADLRNKMKSREDRLKEFDPDPAKFVALVASGQPIDSEGYLQIAITRWLPIAASNQMAQDAVRQIATVLQQKSGDSWLRDLAALDSGPKKLEGLQQLSAAHLANQQGHAGEALTAATNAKDAFLRSGSLPGLLGADFEQVYAFKLNAQPEECRRAAEKLDQSLKHSPPYIWLRTRSRIELAICAMRLGDLKEAAPPLLAAVNAARKAGFHDSALRASGMYVELMANIAAPSEVLSKTEEALHTFWSGAYPALRFYQVVASFVDSAARADQRFVAYFLARSALWAASALHHPLVEATARAKLAVVALAVGEEAEAQSNMAISESFFATSQDARRAAYRLEPQISFARLELERGDVDAALTRLQGLQEALADPPTVRIAAQYYSVLGEALRRKGELAAAAEAFQKSIEFGNRRVASVVSEREHAGALKIIEDSYRGLTAVTIATPGASPEQALRIWHQYRSLGAVTDPGVIPQPNGIVLSYAELPDGFVGWLVRGQRVTMRHLPVSKENARVAAVRFLRSCSDPASRAESLRRDAQQLYQWMIGPFAEQLAEAPAEQNLIIESDGILAAVPWQALMGDDGAYLGERFLVFQSVTSKASRVPSDSLRPDTRTLVIANPAVLGQSAVQFPPLPDSLREAEVVRTSFSNTVIVEGRRATVTALLDWLPNVELVHVSGHGYTNADNGALLFAARDPEKSDYDLLQAAEVSHQDWSRIRLVVLSACATASGETAGPHNPDSLIRALIQAGASRVLASLWNVDSAATAQMMSTFYASLARGNSPVQALRAAQHSLRNNAALAHPYYWAGFQLYGTK